MAKKKNKLSCAVKGDRAIEEVTPTANPEPSTAEPEATAILKPTAEQTPLSPYARNPITINVGPAPVTYYVPWHLLKSTNWSTVPAGGEISLPTMSADTGHILVHYLYTGTYQTLESKISGIAQQPQLALKQALLVYRVSVTHTLDGLEQLARQQIEEHSASMDLKTILNITGSELPKTTEPSGWLQAYLKDKIQKAFEKDHTVFADDAFCASLCKKSKLNDYVMCHVVKLLSEKLTQALAGKGNNTDELDEIPRPQPVPEEIVADKDPFAGLSKSQRKKLENKMRKEKEKARLEEEEGEAAVLAKYGYVGDDPPPAPDVSEELAPVAEPEACWEASAPAPEPETYYEVSIPAPEPEPCYEDSINVVDSEPQEEEKEAACEEAVPAPEPETYYEVSIPAPEPEPCYEDSINVVDSEPQEEEKEAACEEAVPASDAYWEEKEAPCEEAVPTSDAYWEDSAPLVKSELDSVEPELLYEVPPPELIPVEEPKPHVTSSLCPKRSVHIMESDLWKKCETCRTMLREIASQIVYEEDM